MVKPGVAFHQEPFGVGLAFPVPPRGIAGNWVICSQRAILYPALHGTVYHTFPIL